MQDITDLSSGNSKQQEGGLDAPTRHPIRWQEASFYDEGSLFTELERVYDICHGCRRCVSLCNAFPTLFDLVDSSLTMEVDGVAQKDYWKVVDQCYLCDLCYMTKCPYVPPHPWNVDFPHLMLRAKAVKYKKGDVRIRDRLLTSTDTLNKVAGIPLVPQTINSIKDKPWFRKLLDMILGLHPTAWWPDYQGQSARKRLKQWRSSVSEAEATERTTGRVIVFVTCYGNCNEPAIVEDLIAVYEHNGIQVRLAPKELCCGMPKLELGDLEAVQRLQKVNIAELSGWVDDGWDIVAPIPSCVLMFKNELPSLFADDANVIKVGKAMFDPSEYLMLRHKESKLNTVFKHSLGNIAYHVPCHQRVQNIGLKTRELLQLVPETKVQAIERCSGHDGTYAVKSECHSASMKIAKPVVRRVQQVGADHLISDCPLAAHHIAHGLEDGQSPSKLFALVRKAYGI